ncbi:MerR family transcriptional regulator [Nocardia sp. NPDC005978]|uniref:MerR family transcriptional regulator n=1 Tax=unclassified Nocardia TaxID=2637762 RepID=UPI0033A005E5
MTNGTRTPRIGIGELARRTGLAVRTIRFYCDEGLLESERSGGGHRTFDADTAAERLRLVRRLRALGLGLTAIAEVLHGNRSIAEAVAAESARVESEFRALAWRRAALRAMDAAAPHQRDARLALLEVAGDGDAAHERLVRFWHRALPRIPRYEIDAWVCWNVPEPPGEPTVAQLLDYAELTALACDPELTDAVRQQLWRADPASVRDPHRLYAAVGDVMCEVVRHVGDGVGPRAGAELDRFVRAHAAAHGERDSPGFRARLAAGAADGDPRARRFWALTARLLDDRVTVGTAHGWLRAALADAAVVN